jgi:hypothetical protein
MGDLPYEPRNELLIMIKEGVEDQTILDALQGAVILKGHEGVIVGEGKQPKKIILIDALDFMPEKYQ